MNALLALLLAVTAETNVVTRVAVVDMGAAVEVTISGSRGPSFTTFTGPAGFVIDLPDTVLGEAMVAPVPDNAVVRDVLAEQRVAEGVRQARVTLSLAGAVEPPRIRTRGNDVIIRLRSAPNDARRVAVAVADAPAIERAPVALPAAMVEPRPAPAPAPVLEAKPAPARVPPVLDAKLLAPAVDPVVAVASRAEPEPEIPVVVAAPAPAPRAPAPPAPAPVVAAPVVAMPVVAAADPEPRTAPRDVEPPAKPEPARLAAPAPATVAAVPDPKPTPPPAPPAVVAVAENTRPAPLPTPAPAPAPAPLVPHRHSSAGATLLQVGFRHTGSASRVVVSASEAPRFSVIEEGSSVFVYLEGVHAARANDLRALDTSYFPSVVRRVVPRRDPAGTRIEIQLRRAAPYRLETNAGVIAIVFESPVDPGARR
jgi:hypothetical protein